MPNLGFMVVWVYGLGCRAITHVHHFQLCQNTLEYTHEHTSKYTKQYLNINTTPLQYKPFLFMLKCVLVYIVVFR